jgi:hypothetical protein
MYYPAQQVAFCSQGFNDLLPLTICSDTSKDLEAMYEPYYKDNNLSAVSRCLLCRLQQTCRLSCAVCYAPECTMLLGV